MYRLFRQSKHLSTSLISIPALPIPQPNTSYMEANKPCNSGSFIRQYMQFLSHSCRSHSPGKHTSPYIQKADGIQFENSSIIFPIVMQISYNILSNPFSIRGSIWNNNINIYLNTIRFDNCNDIYSHFHN